ncbi:MAG: hypothetical protein ACKPKO_14915, partial [Candidatus Fonsibacter sp.]
MHPRNFALSRLVLPDSRTDEASATNLAAEYAKVRVAKGREEISTALTIHGWVLGIPAAARLLMDM